MTRRRAAVALVAAAVFVLALAAVARRQAIWRAAYPHLPRQLQAAPYRLRAMIGGGHATPVALPTPRGAGSVPSGRATAEVRAAGTAAAGAATTATAASGVAAPARTPEPAASAAMAADPTATPRDRPPTLPPVVWPTGTATAQPWATDVFRPYPAEVVLEAFRHEYQTWNNCGPATVSMALSFFGAAGSQAAAATFLKPDPDDKNVSPGELAAYARSLGFGAVVRVDGTADRMRQLLGLGLPVIVETWFIPEPGDEMGHYRVLRGYDLRGTFVAADSYKGPAVTLSEAELDALWRVFNRTYVVVYPPDMADAVAEELGRDGDDGAMYAGAAHRALEEINARPDAFAWFNLGSSLVGLGDMPGAAEAFDAARSLGLPWRMLWYQFGPFEAYAAVGRWDDVRALADANLANAPNLEESHYWRGRALAAAGDLAGARAAWERALDLNPNYAAPAEALASPAR